MVWNEETIRHLRNLWAEGHSTAEIGRRLGVSKNAIVGKAHRLDLEARPSPIRREAVKEVTDRNYGYPRVATTTLPPLLSDSLPSVGQVSNVQALRITPVATPAIARSPVVLPRPSAERLFPVQQAPRAPVLAGSVAPAPQHVPERPSLGGPRQSVSVQVRRSAPACCWPIGDPGTKAFRFCDDVSLPGKPYCDEHAKLAYVKVRDRKEDAA